MTRQFRILCEVGAGALPGMIEDGDRSFTSREFGSVLHEAQRYLPPCQRYRKPVRRGAVAGQVLRFLREEGLVERTPPRRSGEGRWQLTRDYAHDLQSI